MSPHTFPHACLPTWLLQPIIHPLGPSRSLDILATSPPLTHYSLPTPAHGSAVPSIPVQPNIISDHISVATSQMTSTTLVNPLQSLPHHLSWVQIWGSLPPLQTLLHSLLALGSRWNLSLGLGLGLELGLGVSQTQGPSLLASSYLCSLFHCLLWPLLSPWKCIIEFQRSPCLSPLDFLLC